MYTSILSTNYNVSNHVSSPRIGIYRKPVNTSSKFTIPNNIRPFRPPITIDKTINQNYTKLQESLEKEGISLNKCSKEIKIKLKNLLEHKCDFEIIQTLIKSAKENQDRTIAVLAPDEYSGKLYEKILQNHNLKTEFFLENVAPRFMGNKINTSPDVAETLADAIIKTHKNGFSQISIACNTLQLWLDDAKWIIEKRGLGKILDKIEFINTVETTLNNYTSKSNTVWLGTNVITRYDKAEKLGPLSKYNIKNNFITLDKLGYPDVQEMVHQGIRNAKTPEWAKQDKELVKHSQELMKKLNKVRQDFSIRTKQPLTFIAGCTELPGYLAKHKEIDKVLKIVDPASIVASEAIWRNEFVSIIKEVFLYLKH